MPLILGTTPHNNWQPTRNLCEQAGWILLAEHPETWYQSDKVQVASDDRLLLLHSHPEEAIAYAIAEGTAPETALQEWITAAKAMLNFYKRHRKQAVMAYAPYLLTNPEAQLAAIGSHLRLPADQLPVTAAQMKEVPLLEQMMASHLLRQTPEFSHLLAQIEACTLPLEGHSYRAPELNIKVANENLTTLRNDLTDRDQRLAKLQQELSEQAAEKQKAEDESQLLLEQLHLVQEELEQKLLSHHKLQITEKALRGSEEKLAGEKDRFAAEKSRLEQQQAKLNNKAVESEDQLQNSHEENSLLLEQLHLVQEELESQFMVRQQLDRELEEYREQQDYALEAANNQLKRLQTELNRFRTSATWKATAPVRALKKPFRRNLEKKVIKKQVDLIRQSGLFNEGWYLKSYPDVAEKGTDPIEHYLKFGAEERRNPSPEFDTQFYRTNYPDVVQEGINPLVHYIKFGKNEGRAISAYHHPSLPAPGTV